MKYKQLFISVLRHRYTGYLLDAVFFGALIVGTVLSQQGIDTLRSEGCKTYYKQHVPGVNESDFSKGEFIRKVEQIRKKTYAKELNFSKQNLPKNNFN